MRIGRDVERQLFESVVILIHFGRPVLGGQGTSVCAVSHLLLTMAIHFFSVWVMLRWFSRILLISLIVALSAVSAGLVIVWTQTRREYEAFQERQLEAQAHLSGLQRERESKEAYLRAFLNNPEFVERVVRERLGYVGPGEVVFRFEKP